MSTREPHSRARPCLGGGGRALAVVAAEAEARGGVLLCGDRASPSRATLSSRLDDVRAEAPQPYDCRSHVRASLRTRLEAVRAACTRTGVPREPLRHVCCRRLQVGGTQRYPSYDCIVANCLCGYMPPVSPSGASRRGFHLVVNPGFWSLTDKC